LCVPPSSAGRQGDDELLESEKEFDDDSTYT
jgi:hypothetical protein